jgi:hypothetical protein
MKQAGKPSAGNPHAGFDEAGAGNRLTVRLVRHWSSRQGCKSGKVEVLFPSITCIGRIAYPERAEVTKHDMPGRKSLGCSVGKLAAVGAIWETTQTQRPEHKEMSASSTTNPRKVAFAEQTGSRPIVFWGRPMTSGKKQVRALGGTRRGRGPGIWGKICRDRVGKNPLVAGAGSNLQRLSDRGEEPKEGRARRVWRMSPYERGTGSNVLGGGGPRLPMGGNTDCGQRDSGYLAVSPSAWVAGLIKPVQSPDAVLETRLWANHGVRVYANQRLSLGEEGKAYRRKTKTSNRTGEIPPSGIIGGPRKT